MAKHSIDQCRSGKDFLKFAKAHKAEIRNGKGSHVIVSTPKGSAVVPYHTQDLGPGLRTKLVKVFTAIGLAALLVACAVQAF